MLRSSRNSIIILILAGNLFVRFGVATPGLLILLVQGIMIGWVAGSNAFEFPFASVFDANIRYLKVGQYRATWSMLHRKSGRRLKFPRLGPTLPAFITPNVLDVLVQNFDIKPISTHEEDLEAILKK